MMHSEQALETYLQQLQAQTENVHKYVTEAAAHNTKAQLTKKETFDWTNKWKALKNTAIAFPDAFPQAINIQKSMATALEAIQTQTVAEANTTQQQLATELQQLVANHQAHQQQLASYAKQLDALLVFAEKHLKLKNKTSWNTCFTEAPKKAIAILQESYTKLYTSLAYWHENIAWLQQRFPNAAYQDVIGLCKLADQQEIIEEHDYSLNPGRYVGVEIEEDNLTEEEFSDKMNSFNTDLQELNKESSLLENQINSVISKLF